MRVASALRSVCHDCAHQREPAGRRFHAIAQAPLDGATLASHGASSVPGRSSSSVRTAQSHRADVAQWLFEPIRTTRCPRAALGRSLTRCDLGRREAAHVHLRSQSPGDLRCFGRPQLGGLGLLDGLGPVGLDGLAVQDLTEQDATDEGVALLALEPKLVRPGAIGERRVVEEVLRLLGVRQGLPLRRLLRLLRLRRPATASASDSAVFPIWTLLRRIASSRAFLILSRSLACERPTRME